ncbi:12990_t:CDS:2, partial [Racocetra persica]
FLSEAKNFDPNAYSNLKEKTDKGRENQRHVACWERIWRECKLRQELQEHQKEKIYYTQLINALDEQIKIINVKFVEYHNNDGRPLPEEHDLPALETNLSALPSSSSSTRKTSPLTLSGGTNLQTLVSGITDSGIQHGSLELVESEHQTKPPLQNDFNNDPSEKAVHVSDNNNTELLPEGNKLGMIDESYPNNGDAVVFEDNGLNAEANLIVEEQANTNIGTEPSEKAVHVSNNNDTEPLLEGNKLGMIDDTIVFEGNGLNSDNVVICDNNEDGNLLAPLSSGKTNLQAPSFGELSILAPSEINLQASSFGETNLQALSFGETNMQAPSFEETNLIAPSFGEPSILVPLETNLQAPSFGEPSILVPLETNLQAPSFGETNLSVPSSGESSILALSSPGETDLTPLAGEHNSCSHRRRSPRDSTYRPRASKHRKHESSSLASPPQTPDSYSDECAKCSIHCPNE